MHQHLVVVAKIERQPIRDGEKARSLRTAPRSGKRTDMLGRTRKPGSAGAMMEIFAAIVNCKYETSVGHLNGHKQTYAVAFARMFMTKPAVKAGSERYLSL